MTFEEYREYLRSDDWRERRKQLMDEASWTCSECGNKATELHHDNYDNLGSEELYVDVRPMCSDCHKDEHGNKDEMAGYGDYGT